MRKLYFDIDGTVLVLDTGVPKPALARGMFEAAIRRARFDEVICVGNFAEVVRTLWVVRPEFDGLGATFALCRGAFSDEDWFRSTVRFVKDPKLRAAEVDLGADWWYVDDQAERYFSFAHRGSVFRAHVGKRVCQPSPRGDGVDVLDWLESTTK